MRTLEQEQILITGGSRGLGLGLVEALAARHANVTVVARDSAPLADLKARLGVSVIAGDATDPALADSVLRQVRPSVLVLNAGATPAMARIKGRCQMTSPMPGFTWITAQLVASRVTLPAAPKVAICAL